MVRPTLCCRRLLEASCSLRSLPCLQRDGLTVSRRFYSPVLGLVACVALLLAPSTFSSVTATDERQTYTQPRTGHSLEQTPKGARSPTRPFNTGHLRRLRSWSSAFLVSSFLLLCLFVVGPINGLCFLSLLTLRPSHDRSSGLHLFQHANSEFCRSHCHHKLNKISH